MADYSMGEMPKNPGNPHDEEAMEGLDFETAEEEASEADGIVSQLAGLSPEDLDKVIAEATLLLEESEEDEEGGEIEAEEAPAEESEGGDLSAMFE